MGGEVRGGGGRGVGHGVVKMQVFITGFSFIS